MSVKSKTPNIAVKAAPFGRWTLRDKAPRNAPYLQRYASTKLHEMLKRAVLGLGFSLAISAYGACPTESQLTYVRSKGVEISRPLTVAQVEALTQTGPDGMKDIKPYRSTDPEWQKLKADYRKGDYFVQFWQGRELVEHTKFYMDGLYLVRHGCIVGWLKGAIS